MKRAAFDCHFSLWILLFHYVFLGSKKKKTLKDATLKTSLLDKKLDIKLYLYRYIYIHPFLNEKGFDFVLIRDVGLDCCIK